MIDPNKIKLATDIVRILNLSLEKLFEEVKHEVLVALELPLEGGVAQHLLVGPELLHGDLLQLSGVVSDCGE